MDTLLIDLQTRVAYQDENIQQLSDVVYEQQKQIDRLEKQLLRMGGQLQDVIEGLPLKPQDEVPPHY